MISITVDNFILLYKNEAAQNEFFTTLSAAFDSITTKDTTKLKFLSFTIHRSLYGLSINQTRNIQDKILYPWFENSHHLKFIDTPSTVIVNHE